VGWTFPACSADRGEWCARVLAAICGSALEFRGDPAGRFVDYRELPEAAVDHIASHFGIRLPADDAERMRAVSASMPRTSRCLSRPGRGRQTRRFPASAADSDSYGYTASYSARAANREPERALGPTPRKTAVRHAVVLRFGHQPERRFAYRGSDSIHEYRQP
jgi:hypothetical protein